jgi:hypothetical protein
MSWKLQTGQRTARYIRKQQTCKHLLFDMTLYVLFLIRFWVKTRWHYVYLTNPIFHQPWLQDMFITRVTKSVIKTNKQSRKKRRGWYTKEAMAKDLGWSSLLIFTLYMLVLLNWSLMSHFDKFVLYISQFLLGFRFNTWMSQPITIFKVSTM